MQNVVMRIDHHVPNLEADRPVEFRLSLFRVDRMHYAFSIYSNRSSLDLYSIEGLGFFDFSMDRLAILFPRHVPIGCAFAFEPLREKPTEIFFRSALDRCNKFIPPDGSKLVFVCDFAKNLAELFRPYHPSEHVPYEKTFIVG